MAKKPKDKIVKVTWVDTASQSLWKGKKEVIEWGRKELICESVGYLIEKGKKQIIISAMKDIAENPRDSWYNDHQKIPIGCVKRITHLK